MIVVDSSAIVELLLARPAAPRVMERIFGEGQTIHAPFLVDVEVASVLRRYQLGGELSPAVGKQILEDFLSFPLKRYPHDILLSRAWDLRRNFTAYDAMYLALAEMLDAPLLTADRALASAGHKAAIELI